MNRLTGNKQRQTYHDSTPDADHSVSGTVAEATVGENVTLFQCLYLKSDGKYWKADASAAATCTGKLVLAMGSISADATGAVFEGGYARDDSWSWAVGGAIYVSATAGAIIQTQPAGATDITRVIGHAISATVIYINFSLLTNILDADDDLTLPGDLILTSGALRQNSLTDGYIPYHVSDAAGLADSPVYTDGTDVGIGTTSPLSALAVNGGVHVGGDSDAGDNNLLVDGTITTAESITISSGPFSPFVASGAITDGDKLFLRDDGTVQIIGDTLTLGDAYEFEDGEVGYEYIAYIGDDKFVVIYTDANESSYWYAKVGTISGTEITYGARTTFYSAEVRYLSLCHIGSGVVVVCFEDHSTGEGYGIVGTVSGTSISFGTATKMTNVGQDYDWSSVCSIGSSKVVVAYNDVSSTPRVWGVVGTVSGTGISFGTAVNTNTGSDSDVSVCYAAANKVVVFAGSSDQGWAKVGSVSGTAISFGTISMFGTSGESCSQFDTVYLADNSIFIVYSYATAAADEGFLVIGTVSGTDISFGTDTKFTDYAFYPRFAICDISATGIYDYGAAIFYNSYVGGDYHGFCIGAGISGTDIFIGGEQDLFTGFLGRALGDGWEDNKIIVAYSISDLGGDDDGDARIVTVEFDTASRFIGIANETVNDGESVQVGTLSSIVDNQTGLTIGTNYYIDNAGDLQTTGVDGSLVGKALSTTKMLIKGG